MPCPLYKLAQRQPDAIAVCRDGWQYTFADFDLLVQRYAAALAARHVAAGQCLAVAAANSIQYLALIVAALRQRLVICPLNIRWPGASLRAAIQHVDAALIVADDAMLAVLDLPAVAFEELNTTATALSHAPSWDPSATATVVFTSGTSSATPKAAVHRLENHCCSARGANTNLPLVPGDRWLLALPLYHVGGLAILFRCLLSGAAVALAPADRPVGESVSRTRATHLSVVPAQLGRLLRQQLASEQLRAVLVGGARLPAAVAAEALEAGLPLHTTYGSTEMASQITATPPGTGQDDLHTCGKVLPYREIKISDDGEILVRGSTLFDGYLTTDGVRAAVDRDGWFATGDRGELDDQLRLVVHGRVDNMFISGGENVQPEEIEARLCESEGVAEAVVLPVPDEEFDQRPAAFVRMLPGYRLEAGALAAELAAVLPGFKVPVRFLTWPRTLDQNGAKPCRHALQMHLEQQLQR
ncbi:MAG: o-succinylbenzoate--CoA ligase [Lentisphaeria bacterium]|jgi:O-succinylbenzoic acid--CoA ligase|nr:o-succinylbenzoate--CoA ligase [Lentisphaeria bacterium]